MFNFLSNRLVFNSRRRCRAVRRSFYKRNIWFVLTQKAF